MNRTILLAADHNGIELKAHLKEELKVHDYRPVDLGPFHSGVSVDYVDYARQLSEIIANGDAGFGILVCGTGVGMSIVANKTPGIRAALVDNPSMAHLTREHNDANVLCLGSWKNNTETQIEIVTNWLDAKFGEYRHVRRVARIDPMPAGKIVFANGCFDILHSGHIELLNFARQLGDKLIVAINSDESIYRIKGPGRPVNCENDRKKVIQSLRSVDEVVIFEGISTSGIIHQIRPNVVVKGGEWTADEVRERDGIPSWAEVVIYPLKPGYSSTNIIKSIRSRHASPKAA